MRSDRQITHQTHLSPHALAAASASVDQVRALAPLGARASLCAFKMLEANEDRPAVFVAAAVELVLDVVAAGLVEVVAGLVDVEAALVDVEVLLDEVEVVLRVVEVDREEVLEEEVVAARPFRPGYKV